VYVLLLLLFVVVPGAWQHCHAKKTFNFVAKRGDKSEEQIDMIDLGGKRATERARAL